MSRGYFMLASVIAALNGADCHAQWYGGYGGGGGYGEVGTPYSAAARGQAPLFDGGGQPAGDGPGGGPWLRHV